MTEVRFYHLQTKSVNQALPEILAKAYSGGRRVVVKAADESAVKKLNDDLWTYDAHSFLPHGSKAEGHAKHQPIWLTTEDENPNSADVLILTGGSTSDNMSDYDLCCEMLDGHDAEAVAAARQRWKDYKEAGFEITYWQQNERGGWDKKA